MSTEEPSANTVPNKESPLFAMSKRADQTATVVSSHVLSILRRLKHVSSFRRRFTRASINSGVGRNHGENDPSFRPLLKVGKDSQFPSFHRHSRQVLSTTTKSIRPPLTAANPSDWQRQLIVFEPIRPSKIKSWLFRVRDTIQTPSEVLLCLG